MTSECRRCESPIDPTRWVDDSQDDETRAPHNPRRYCCWGCEDRQARDDHESYLADNWRGE